VEYRDVTCTMGDVYSFTDGSFKLKKEA